jgi:hypothetical protein
MTSIFDSAAFNDSLFFPRGDDSEPPAGAVDAMIDVGGARVHLRRHAAVGARCTLLLFHGNGEVVADYDDAAPVFATAGVALAVVEFRGYGRSEGTATLRAIVDDARAVAASIDGPMIAMGRSLGGMAVHGLYANPTAGMIGVVLESALSDLRGLIRRRGLQPPATFSDDEIARYDPATKLARGTLPLLVLHGERDTLIDPREARASLAAAGTTDKQLVMIPGRGHNDVSLHARYWEALGDFVTRIAS